MGSSKVVYICDLRFAFCSPLLCSALIIGQWHLSPKLDCLVCSTDVSCHDMKDKLCPGSRIQCYEQLHVLRESLQGSPVVLLKVQLAWKLSVLMTALGVHLRL